MAPAGWLTFLLSSDQGLGTPIPGRLQSRAAPEAAAVGQSPGQHRHLVAARVHHSRKCPFIGFISTHHTYAVLRAPPVCTGRARRGKDTDAEGKYREERGRGREHESISASG